MIIGGLIYILFRDGDFRFLNWLNILGLSDVIQFIKFSYPWQNDLPNWVLYNLPDGIWFYSLTSLMIIIWTNAQNKLKYFWFSFISALVILVEFGQLTGTIPGTFDKSDILFCIAAITAPYYLIKTKRLKQ